MSDAFAQASAATPAIAVPVLDGATEAMAIPDFAGLAPAAPSADPISPPSTAAKPAHAPRPAVKPVNWLGPAAAAAVVGGLVWFGMPAGDAQVDAETTHASVVTTSASVPVAPPVTQNSAPQNPSPRSATLQSPLPLKPAPKPTTPKTASSSQPLPAQPVEAPSAEAPIAPVSFTSVKLMRFVNEQASTLDVVLQFHDAELVAFLHGGADPVTRVAYSGIAAATYVYAKDPQWNDAASAPRRVNVPGLVLRKRHWLVLQTQHSYAILQLDNDNWSNVLKTLEARTGVVVGRPIAPAKTRQAGLPNR